MARTSNLTPELHDRVVAAVRAGLPRTLAAAAAGIEERTIYVWLARAEVEEGAGPYTRFARELQNAEADRVRRCLRQIRATAETGSWQAAAWFLERRYPEYFGRRPVADRPPAPASPMEFTPGQAHALLREALDDLLRSHPELESHQPTEVAR